MKKINYSSSTIKNTTKFLLLFFMLTLGVNQVSKARDVPPLPDGYMGGYLHTKAEIINIVNNAPSWVFLDPTDNGDPSPSTLPGNSPSFAGLTNYVLITLSQTGFTAIYESRWQMPGAAGGSYEGYNAALSDFRLAMGINGFRY